MAKTYKGRGTPSAVLAEDTKASGYCDKDTLNHGKRRFPPPLYRKPIISANLVIYWLVLMIGLPQEPKYLSKIRLLCRTKLEFFFSASVIFLFCQPRFLSSSWCV